jgi:hypothetical protein
MARRGGRTRLSGSTYILNELVKYTAETSRTFHVSARTTDCSWQLRAGTLRMEIAFSEALPTLAAAEHIFGGFSRTTC